MSNIVIIKEDFSESEDKILIEFWVPNECCDSLQALAFTEDKFIKVLLYQNNGAINRFNDQWVIYKLPHFVKRIPVQVRKLGNLFQIAADKIEEEYWVGRMERVLPKKD